MTVIYRCTDRKGQALYIGASRSLPQRLNRHRTEAIWWPLVADVQIVSEHEDRQEAFVAEVRGDPVRAAPLQRSRLQLGRRPARRRQAVPAARVVGE